MIRDKKENEDNWHHRIRFETKKMGWTYGKDERLLMDRAQDREATQEKQRIRKDDRAEGIRMTFWRRREPPGAGQR